MKNWIYITVAAVFAVLLLSSCWSTVPKAVKPVEAEEGVYTIQINDGNGDGLARQYAINNFVQSLGHDSYDYEVLPRTTFFSAILYKVTVPGSIPVEDLPKVRVWHTLNGGSVKVEKRR